MRAFLKGQCLKIFDFCFFHKLVSHKPLSIPLGPFWFFWKFAEIFTAQGAPLVSRTPGANGKNINMKSFDYIARTLLDSRPNIKINFFLQVSPRPRWKRWQFAPSVINTSGKFAACCIDTGGKFATSINDTSGSGGKFAAGVVDTSGKFAISVVDTSGKFFTIAIDTGGAPWLANIATNFQTNLKCLLRYFQRLGGRWLMKKNLEQKISWHFPFTNVPVGTRHIHFHDV